MLEFVNIAKAILLGIIEGLTEFIPVSSTAHLLLSSHIINFHLIKNNLFEIVIQLGAIMAICVAYRQRIIEVFINFKQRSQQRFILNLVLAFLPASLVGLAFYSFIKSIFFTNITIALALIIGGILMIVVENKPKKILTKDVNDIRPLTALYIGLFQCLAMIPGVSRSGSTIIGGLLLGLNRKAATEFSFFLAIPTIIAASIYDFVKNVSDLSRNNMEIIFIGLISSFFAAILVIKWFINYVSKYNFVAFGVYRILIGILVLLFIV